MSHTPGKWENSNGMIGTWVEGRKNWTHVADAHGFTYDELVCNARLIAAAPDLLDTLMKIEDYALAYPDLETIVLMCQYAISKATKC